MAVLNVTGIEGCYCKTESAHHKHSYGGSHCSLGTVVPGWKKLGLNCFKGHKNNHKSKEFQERFPNFHYTTTTDIASALSDFYLLESIMYDVANPRPFTVADVDTTNFHTVDHVNLLKLIGVSGPKKVSNFLEKHNPGADVAASLNEQYEKWQNILAPNVKIDKSLISIKEQAKEAFDNLIVTLSGTLRDYAYYAICSELSYHAKMGHSFDTDVGTYSTALGWMDMAELVGNAEAGRFAAELFRDKTSSNKKAWGAQYGGPKWAAAADILSFFEDGVIPTKSKKSKPFDAKLFCDRMFSLQHNTGSFLNKVYWGPGRAFEAGYGVGNLISLLDSHHNSDWYRLDRTSSEEVHDLMREYWTVTNREFIRAGLEPVPFPTQSPAYTNGSPLGPDFTLMEETPGKSNKANILLAGSEQKVNSFEIPENVLRMGKKIVHYAY